MTKIQNYSLTLLYVTIIFFFSASAYGKYTTGDDTIIFCYIRNCSASTYIGGESTMNCDSAHGFLVEGVENGVKYCISNNAMNQWSASTWCNAVGGELVDLDNACGDACGDISTNSYYYYYSCPNLVFDSEDVPFSGWTRSYGHDRYSFNTSFNMYITHSYTDSTCYINGLNDSRTELHQAICISK